MMRRIKKVKKNSSKKIDILFFLIFPIIAYWFLMVIQANIFIAGLVYYGIPILYLGYRAPQNITRSIIFSLLMAIPIGVIFDYMGFLDHAWIVKSAFPYMLYGKLPLEDSMWAFLFSMEVILFYEYFMDHIKHKVVEGRIKYMFIIVFMLLSIFFALFFFAPQYLLIPYFYTYLGIIGLGIPSAILLFLHPKLLIKFLILTIYFFPVTALSEIQAFQMHQWVYPGNHFLGYVLVVGSKLPYEEILNVFILSAMGTVAYFELFDTKKIE